MTMRTGMMLAILLSFMATSGATAAMRTDGKEEQTIEVSAPASRGELNIAVITYDLVTRDMGQAEWDSFVKKVQSRFRDWSQEYDNNNLKQFLDDRLLELAPSVTSGKGHSLKEFCKWIALYNVYSEQLPRYIRDVPDSDKLWIQRELADFDWNRTALKIKENHKK
jgi:hypothetical protein